MAAIFLAGAFLLDLLAPVDIVVLLLYFVPLLVVSRAPAFRASLVLAAAATALIGAGYAIKSHVVAREFLRTTAPDRILAAGALWITTAVLVRRARAEAALKETNDALRDEIRQRLEVAEKAQVEHALRESIANSLPIGLLAVDLEERITFVNEAFCAMTGLSRKEMLGTSPPYLFWPPEQAERYRDVSVGVLTTGRAPDAVEVQFLRRSGERFDVLKRTSPIRDSQGILYGYAASVTDVTDRKRAEAALEESEDRFRSLVRHSLMGFFIVQKGRIVFLNPEQEKIFGAVPEGFALERLAETVHPDDLSKFATLLMAVHGGDERTHETDFRFEPFGSAVAGRDSSGIPHDTRAPRWVHARMAPIAWRGREAVLITMIDITRVKELERIAMAQEKMAALGQMAAGVAHEIRNPLSGLNISLSSLDKTIEGSRGLEPDSREAAGAALATAQTASKKIGDVIQRVMDFVSPAPPKREVVSVNRCIEEALSLSQVALRKADVQLTKTLQEDLPKVSADTRLLEHVLVNLVTNAMQAMETKAGDKAIAVTSSLEDGFVVIRVADSGPGVPEELREKIFEPYYTTRRGGTGIGLSWSRKIMGDHGGFIRVDRSRFGGALFSIGLPAGDEKSGIAAA